MAITLDGTNGVTTPDLTVDTDTLTVDATNNRVGIGTSSPSTSNLTISSSAASDTPNIRIETFRPNIRFADLSTSAVDAEIKMDGNALRFNLSAEVNNDTALTERMRIDSNGNLLVNTTNTGLYSSTSDSGVSVVSNELGVAKSGTCFYANRLSSDGSVFSFFRNGSFVGYISVTGSSTSYNTSSDYRLKTDVQPMVNATERLKALKPVNFEWIADGTRVDGFLAHEAQDVVPEAVTGTKDAVQVWKEGEELPEGVAVGDNKLDENGNTIPDYQGIDQSKLVPLLVATIQELEARIEALENN